MPQKGLQQQQSEQFSFKSPPPCQVLYDMQIFLPFESVASPSPSGFEKQLKSSPTFRGAGARGIKLPFVFWDEEHFGGGDMI